VPDVVVRDDPDNPDPGFAELYAGLPDAEDVEPWLSAARAAGSPVLYLGVGAGRLAVPLAREGILMVAVDSHPAMLERLKSRIANLEMLRSRIEELELGQTFSLVIGPSSILNTPTRLVKAAAQLSPEGRLLFEMTNPHWLFNSEHERVRVVEKDRNRAAIEVLYELKDGRRFRHRAEQEPLVWPEEIEAFLRRGGLVLQRLDGRADLDLQSSPTYFVLARLE
jgi:2-polyprenyl-3-methyl-5-hydroxy-6-metoxy-1,4-benzoquinol methylase